MLVQPARQATILDSSLFSTLYMINTDQVIQFLPTPPRPEYLLKMSMSEREESLEQQLAVAEKTIAVLMKRLEQALNVSASSESIVERQAGVRPKHDPPCRPEEIPKNDTTNLVDEVQLRTSQLLETSRQLHQRNQLLNELIRKDGLTGLFNHTTMMEIIHDKVEESRRYGHPLCLLMFDIDHFKKVNDTHGHLFGDHVLKSVGNTLLKSIRSVDYAGRFGGEEFAVLVPSTKKKGAIITAEKIRKKIARLNWPHYNCSITISCGVAELANHTTEDLIAQADSYLYLAKDKGRNRVVSMSYTQSMLPLMGAIKS